MSNSNAGGKKTQIGNVWDEQKSKNLFKKMNCCLDISTKQLYSLKNNKPLNVERFSKYEFYNTLMKKYNVDYRNFFKKRVVPDECFINFNTMVAFIFERKCQNSEGSVYEKLAVYDYKIEKYHNILNSIGFDVVFLYQINSFLEKNYPDIIQHLKNNRVSFFVEEIPDYFLNRILAQPFV